MASILSATSDTLLFTAPTNQPTNDRSLIEFEAFQVKNFAQRFLSSFWKGLTNTGTGNNFQRPCLILEEKSETANYSNNKIFKLRVHYKCSHAR